MIITATIAQDKAGQWLATVYQDGKASISYRMRTPLEAAEMAGRQIELWLKPVPDMGYGSGKTAQHTGD